MGYGFGRMGGMDMVGIVAGWGAEERSDAVEGDTVAWHGSTILCMQHLFLCLYINQYTAA